MQQLIILLKGVILVKLENYHNSCLFFANCFRFELEIEEMALKQINANRRKSE